MTLAYMEDVARQAGISTAPIALPDVGQHGGAPPLQVPDADGLFV